MTKKVLLRVILSIIVLVGLFAFIINKNEALTAEAQGTSLNHAALYDIGNIMSFYVESINSENTLIHSHYTQETSPDKKVNCISCHDIETLRTLFLLCDIEAINKAKLDMYKIINDTCFTCHGSYAELIILTKNYENFQDSKGEVVNPHDTMMGEASCNICHSMHIFSDPVTNGLISCYGCHTNEEFSTD